MALSCGQCPDHSTISSFITSMQDEIIMIYQNILLICEKEGLLGSTSFSLDGLKLPANASKEMSGTFSELTHKKKKLEEKVCKLIKRHQRTDDKENKDDDRYSRNQEKQIDRLKRRAGKIDKFLKENEPKINHRGQEIKSNITDNDSEKMVTSHGTIQGYNGQALVDDKFQIIVHAEAMGKGQDREHVLPIGLPMTENYWENQHILKYGTGNIRRNVIVCQLKEFLYIKYILQM